MAKTAKNLVLPTAERALVAGLSLPRRFALTLVRAVHSFWRHGDLFSGAAISFYALFSLLPLAILLLVLLQLIFPVDAVTRNMGQLFGGLTDKDLLLTTIKAAYAEKGSFGLFGAVTLIVAAAGVFGAVQSALDRVWEVRGRIFHLRFLVGILTMIVTLLIFVGMLLGTIEVFRMIRTSELGALLGWPRRPTPGSSSALTIALTLAQFGVFWTGYRFLPNASVRWRDAWPGAVVATAVWHTIAYLLSWYLARVASYETLYHQLQAIMVLLLWVYGLAASFLFGAEFVVQWTTGPESPNPLAPPPNGAGAA